MAEQQAITMKDVLALLEIQAEQNRKQMFEFAAELKKPDPETAAKNAEDKARKAAILKANIDSEIAIAAARKQAQAGCPHVKKNGMPSFGGQVHNDGAVHPICTQCQKELPPIKAPLEWIQNGVNFQDKEMYPQGGLTERTLFLWHEQWGPHSDHCGCKHQLEPKPRFAKPVAVAV